MFYYRISTKSSKRRGGTRVVTTTTEHREFLMAPHVGERVVELIVAGARSTQGRPTITVTPITQKEYRQERRREEGKGK